MKKAKHVKRIGAVAATAIAGVMAFGLTASGADASDAKYYTDYNSIEEAKEAAEQLTREIAGEGFVLLKNQDNALPLSGDEWVSVFGVRSDNLIGASDSSGAHNTDAESSDETVADVLETAGFNVNPTLKEYYSNDSSDIGDEETEFNGQVNSSISMYNDVAFIVLSREGGEGSDASRVTEETVDESTDDHRALLEGTNEEGETVHYKHSLMLTDSETELINKVKTQFDKVVIIINSSNAMEISSLENDEDIDGIINIGRPGVGGLAGLADILTGAVNPSGALIDEWMTDFTADPTWYNFGSNNQTAGYEDGAGSNSYLHEDGTVVGSADKDTAYDSEGYHGVDYEESIYLGYKYYETYYYDKYQEDAQAAQDWWESSVTYPFGYGLSYTTFSFAADTIYTDEELQNPLGSSVEASLFNSDTDSPAQVKKLYVPVTVTNTGSVAGKKIVQAYISAPYTVGGIEKASVSLVGYTKTDIIEPGESETVIVEFNVQDMASWDYSDANEDGVKGDYELDAGEYVLRIMEDSHYDCTTDLEDTTDAYSEVRFTLSETVHQHLDDYSDNELENLFSEDNGTWDDTTELGDLRYNNIRTGSMMADGESGMTLLSRADMDGTFPKAPTTADLTFNDNVLSNWAYWDNYRVTDNVEIDSSTGLPTDVKTTEYYDGADQDTEDMPWYKTTEDIPDNWTQAEGTYDENHMVKNNRTELQFGMYVSSADESPIKFADMAGVDYDDELWDEFLNQLTYDELCTIIEFGGYSTVDIESVGKEKTEDTDGPNNVDGTHCWCSEGVIAATWNVELANKQGQLVGDIALLHGVEGWYGPGADIHRSPFSGRNNEYYSQDGLQGGYIAAAVIQGVQSKGVICYVKHCFMNDQETNRGNLFTWADEQAIRENYSKNFQMALQEGGSFGAMTGYGRLAGFSNTNNYNLGTELYQNQWGVQTYFVTDGYIGWRNRTDPDIMVRTGNQMELYTTPFVEYLSGEWDAEKQMVVLTYTDENGSEVTVESPTQWYAVRQTAKGILYQLAQSAAQFNGYSELNISGGELTPTTQGQRYGASVSIADRLDEGSSVTYELTGVLPDGITFDSLTGEFSGTSQTAGTYEFTVDYTIDGWITKSANYTLNVEAAIYLNEDGDSTDSLVVGQEFMGKVETTYSTDNYPSITYQITEGELPEGLTLAEDGMITGTPVSAGVYTVVVEVTASEEAENEAADDGDSGASMGGSEGDSSDSESTASASMTITFIVSE